MRRVCPFELDFVFMRNDLSEFLACHEAEVRQTKEFGGTRCPQNASAARTVVNSSPESFRGHNEQRSCLRFAIGASRTGVFGEADPPRRRAQHRLRVTRCPEAGWA
jgi:hypothetical protein